MEYSTKAEIEKELDDIDKSIINRSQIIEDLKCRRYELLAQLEDISVNDAIECAIENGISPKRLIDLIISEIRQTK